MQDGKSRGHAVIEYDHPVEAVQAISMFNNQSLYDRKITVSSGKNTIESFIFTGHYYIIQINITSSSKFMIQFVFQVRFDKQPGPTPEELSQLPSRLPEGLAGVGMGLGSGGNPLTDVAKNLPSAAQNQQNITGNQGPSNLQSQNASVAAAALGAAGLAQLQSLLPSQQMQTPPAAMATLMGGTSQANPAGQGGPNSGGISNELSALAVLARQLQNAGGLQGLSALTGNLNGGNGPNNSGGSGMPMGMKNEPPQGGMGMSQVCINQFLHKLQCSFEILSLFDIFVKYLRKFISISAVRKYKQQWNWRKYASYGWNGKPREPKYEARVWAWRYVDLVIILHY